MGKFRHHSLWLALAIVQAAASLAWGQSREDQTVRDSITVLREIMEIPAKEIPRDLLKESAAVVVVPKVIKGSLVVGARHGNGVLMVRDEQGTWHAPVFVSLNGGNIGWQVGVQSTDVILVFRTPQSVNALLSGKFTIGADAAVAAGPVGRQAAAATDSKLADEILSWSRSRGLFAGVALDGSVIKIDQQRNSNYYHAANPDDAAVVPDSAQQLAALLLQYSGTSETATRESGRANATLVPQLSVAPPASDKLARLRSDLAKSSNEMDELLSAEWHRYLALPKEVYSGSSHPAQESIQAALMRFDAVSSDPRYAALANHPKFKETQGLLKQYATALPPANSAISLPAPPGAPNGTR